MNIQVKIQPVEVQAFMRACADMCAEGLVLRGREFVFDNEYEVAELSVDKDGVWTIDIDHPFGPGEAAMDLINKTRAYLEEGVC